MNKSAPETIDFISRIEQIGKVAVIVVALLYSLGLIVTNAYLLKFGYSEFELLRSRFVLTGIITITPTFVLAFSGWVASSVVVGMSRSHDGQTTKRRSYIQLGVTVIATVLLDYAFFSGLFTLMKLDEEQNRLFLKQLLLGSWPFALIGVDWWDGLIGGTLSRRAKAEPNANRPSILREIAKSHQAIAITSVFVVFFIGSFFVATFAEAIYPKLPEQLGGGKSKTVQLLFTSESIQAVSQLHIDVMAGSSLSVPLKLIWQDDSGYLVQIDGEIDGEEESIVLIDKDLVQAVVIDVED